MSTNRQPTPFSIELGPPAPSSARRLNYNWRGQSGVGPCREETGSGTEKKGIGCFKAIALPAKDQTTRLEPVQGTAGSIWSEQRSKRYLTSRTELTRRMSRTWTLTARAYSSASLSFSRLSRAASRTN
jgi:hypothetical protein